MTLQLTANKAAQLRATVYLLLAGHNYATLLRLSIVCLSSVTYALWLNGASYQKHVWRSK